MNEQREKINEEEEEDDDDDDDDDKSLLHTGPNLSPTIVHSRREGGREGDDFHPRPPRRDDKRTLRSKPSTRERC